MPLAEPKAVAEPKTIVTPFDHMIKHKGLTCRVGGESDNFAFCAGYPVGYEFVQSQLHAAKFDGSLSTSTADLLKCYSICAEVQLGVTTALSPYPISENNINNLKLRWTTVYLSERSFNMDALLEKDYLFAGDWKQKTQPERREHFKKVMQAYDSRQPLEAGLEKLFKNSCIDETHYSLTFYPYRGDDWFASRRVFFKQMPLARIEHIGPMLPKAMRDTALERIFELEGLGDQTLEDVSRAVVPFVRRVGRSVKKNPDQNMPYQKSSSPPGCGKRFHKVKDLILKHLANNQLSADIG